MAYSWLRQWAHTKMEKLPPECVQIATALIILWMTVLTDTPSHIGTQWLWTKSPADWLTRTASRLSTRWVWPKDVYTSGGFMGHVVHLPPIPQHPRTPGHKAFRSQLTANELGGIRFAGVGSKWSTVQPRSARANPLWQPRALGIWGRYLPTKTPHLSGTPDAHGSDLQLMSPPGTSR